MTQAAEHEHQISPEFRFCPRCATALQQREVYDRVRPVCPNCDFIYFQEPKVVVAVIATRGDKLLMQRRIMQPGRGKWTVPSGFVDAGERLEDAAIRETKEETNAEVEITRLVGVYSEPGDPIVLIVYEGAVKDGEVKAGPEALEVGFFDPDHLPELAFERDKRIIEVWHRLREKA